MPRNGAQQLHFLGALSGFPVITSRSYTADLDFLAHGEQVTFRHGLDRRQIIFAERTAPQLQGQQCRVPDYSSIDWIFDSKSLGLEPYQC